VSARAQIEASLQARWSLDELAVYGDALIAEGDVRGELIALDLHREPRPLPIKRSRQRLALLARWLGEELAEPAYDLTRYGFIHTRPDSGEALLPVLERVSPYVRSIDFLSYRRAEITQLLEALAAAPRPWLGRLAITLNGDVTVRGPIADDALAARLIAATPHLAELEIEARDLFAAFPHPALERLRSSHRGIRTLAGDNAIPLPRVTEFDLALTERWRSRPRRSPPSSSSATTRCPRPRATRGRGCGRSSARWAPSRAAPSRAPTSSSRSPRWAPSVPMAPRGSACGARTSPRPRRTPSRSRAASAREIRGGYSPLIASSHGVENSR
jgi:hypothetical protein